MTLILTPKNAIIAIESDINLLLNSSCRNSESITRYVRDNLHLVLIHFQKESFESSSLGARLVKSSELLPQLLLITIDTALWLPMKIAQLMDDFTLGSSKFLLSKSDAFLDIAVRIEKEFKEHKNTSKNLNDIADLCRRMSESLNNLRKNNRQLFSDSLDNTF